MFPTLSIGSKIALGFTAVLSLMLLIVGFSITNLQSGSSDFKSYREFARESVLSGRVQANMLMATRAAGSFLKTRDETHYEVYRNRIAQAKLENGKIAEIWEYYDTQQNESEDE